MSILKHLRALTMVSAAGMGMMGGEASADSHPRISVQLWSLKDDVSRDFEGSIRKLAAMGFEGVEFAGNFGRFAHNPRGLKAFLAQNGMVASGAHLPFERFDVEHFATTVAFYHALGCQNLIITRDPRGDTKEGMRQIAAELAELSGRLKPFGMRIGYHNDAELGDLDQQAHWDILATSTPHDVILQQAVGRTDYAQAPNFAQKYPGRRISTHYQPTLRKESDDSAHSIGQDSVHWAELVLANATVGGTQWLTVAQAEYPAGMTPLDCVEASMRGLKQVIAALSVKA